MNLVKLTLLIGLDGFNPSDILVHPDDYPNINLMIKNGSSTFTARTAVETISAPGWTSILCSLDSSDTGVLDNSWAPGEIKDITEVDDQINSDKLKLPCIFETIKNYDPNVYTGFYYEWDWLSYFGNDYSEKINVDDERFCNGVNLMSTLLCSVKHVEMLIDKIKNEDFDFLFIYINIVDDSGHAFNWLSSGYNHYVRKFDEFLGRIFNAFSEKNILNSTYIMLTSDHGGRPGSRFHGEQKNSSLFIPWIIIGPDVKKNYSIKTNVHAMDSAPTILHTLNIPSNPLWRGKVIYEIFENEFIDNLPPMQKTLNKGFTVNFQGNKQGVIETQDGNLFKLVDKEKKINTKPLMVFVYDIITMINAMMSLIMWDSVNKYLFDDSPFKNYVINNAIVFTTKIVVVLFGIIGVTFVFKKNDSWIQLYSTVRLIETFMIGSLKFVYTIGLFRYSIENEEDPTQKNDFKRFTDTLAVVNLFDCLTFIILNIYFCNQLWIGINRKLSLESVKRKSLKLDNL